MESHITICVRGSRRNFSDVVKYFAPTDLYSEEAFLNAVGNRLDVDFKFMYGEWVAIKAPWRVRFLAESRYAEIRPQKTTSEQLDIQGMMANLCDCVTAAGLMTEIAAPPTWGNRAGFSAPAETGGDEDEDEW